MARAVPCPICKGKGKITNPSIISATSIGEIKCHGCGGKGWVEVSD